MSNLEVTRVSSNNVITDGPTKKKPISAKERVNSILEGIDKKTGLSMEDVDALGAIPKEKRAAFLGLNADKYIVRVDSKAGLVNILKKTGKTLNTWLSREVKKDNRISNQQSTAVHEETPKRLIPNKKDSQIWGTKTPIKVINNKDGSKTYIIPFVYCGGGALSDGVYSSDRITIKNGKTIKYESYISYTNPGDNIDMTKYKGEYTYTCEEYGDTYTIGSTYDYNKGKKVYGETEKFKNIVNEYGKFAFTNGRDIYNRDNYAKLLEKGTFHSIMSELRAIPEEFS